MNNMHCHIRYCVALIITSLLSCITQNEPMMSLSTVTLLMLHQDINSAHEWRRPRGSVWANVWLILKAVKEQSRSQPTPKCHSPYIIPACIFHRGTPAYTRLPALPTRQKRSRHSRVENGSASWPSITQRVSKESGNLDSERMSFLEPTVWPGCCLINYATVVYSMQNVALLMSWQLDLRGWLSSLSYKVTHLSI